MTLKYLLIPLAALALGFAAPVTVAKGHGHQGKGHAQKSHEGHEKKSHDGHEKKSHEGHEKKRHNENSNKQSDEGSRRGLEQAEERHHQRKHKNKEDCGDHCVAPLHSGDKKLHKKGVSGTRNHPLPVPVVNLPTLPKVNIPVPVVVPPKASLPVHPKIGFPELPKVSVPAPLPANPVDGLIDKAADTAKQKAREIP